MVNLRVLNLLISEHIKNKSIKIYLVRLGFIKWLFKCFKINKLRNLKLTILRFWPSPGSYLYYCTGLDYTGPLFIKSKTDTTLKVYILLFTCTSSCALHLKLTPDMKTLSFIRAFERFTARPGTPDVIINDNLNDNYKW